MAEGLTSELPVKFVKLEGFNQDLGRELSEGLKSVRDRAIAELSPGAQRIFDAFVESLQAPNKESQPPTPPGFTTPGPGK